ncbi:MAG: methyltransferase domain-containing protein [Thermomicrobiales bacterium]
MDPIRVDAAAVPAFAGSVPECYQRYFVPLIFEPYAVDLARRAARRQPSRVLELAAGTGVVTRHLAEMLPSAVPIVATDLSQAMLDQAAAEGIARPVEWQQADAMNLPFPDASFDLVLCQFGVMFFPDKAHAYAEARRVLQPGGQFIFSVWDRIEENDFANAVTGTLASVFPDDPPDFMARIPHGYHDLDAIADDLRRGGFAREAEMATLASRSRAASARMAALAYCQGSPVRGEIESRGPSRIAEVTDTVTAALADRFGDGAVDGKIQAHVIAVEA